MVDIIYEPAFKRSFKKIKSKELRTKIINQIKKIISNPEVGKPMRYDRVGTREVYIKPHRLSYRLENNVIYILALYHKDEQ